ncbi:uncharacterized protein EDB91DRAFT_1250892 [Suillus paluster]|uniref:uncharacterized protein n=1 Tax=Suillus paluster TaxID=48578 RepID=UPI001B86EE7F|nr:uncharacterized protein EDB91DRAFT_1250892 [Suillus paluster]KAG1734379.1 hypothetical protein EDB91DRAFT_1250892 [Suillus paluster]
MLDTQPSQPAPQDTNGSDQSLRWWDNFNNPEPQTLRTMTPSEDMVIMHEHPDQPFDWVRHNTFDFDNPVIEGGPPLLGSQSMLNEAYYSQLSSPQVHHAPYTISQWRHHRDIFSHAVEQGEGSSQSAAFDNPPPVPGVPPPTLVTPSPTPPPVPSPVLSSVPAAQPVPSIMFGLADLGDVKAKALLQMKRSIFDSSFLPSDNSDVERMARACITAQVSHSIELTAWATMKAGKKEIVKLCTALTTLRKNIQFLTRSAMLWGYGLHWLMHMESKQEVKKFVKSLIQDDFFLRGVINPHHLFSFLVDDRSCYFIQVNGTNVDIPFGNVAILYYIQQLLFHDRQYKHHIGMKQNLRPLEFKDLDFKLTEATTEHVAMEMLFNTLSDEQHCALTASVYI